MNTEGPSLFNSSIEIRSHYEPIGKLKAVQAEHITYVKAVYFATWISLKENEIDFGEIDNIYESNILVANKIYNVQIVYVIWTNLILIKLKKK